MRDWVMRIVGGLNVIFGAGGFWYSAVMLSAKWRTAPGNPSKSAWYVFISLLVLSSVLVSLVVYLGVCLLKRGEDAVRGATIVFAAEILCFLVYVPLFWLVLPLYAPAWPGSAGHLPGMMLGPLVPQIATGYPLLGLLAMLLIWPRKASGRVGVPPHSVG